jgi:hypothetical protein
MYLIILIIEKGEGLTAQGFLLVWRMYMPTTLRDETATSVSGEMNNQLDFMEDKT